VVLVAIMLMLLMLMSLWWFYYDFVANSGEVVEDYDECFN
jgi:hypothetical protein